MLRPSSEPRGQTAPARGRLERAPDVTVAFLHCMKVLTSCFLSKRRADFGRGEKAVSVAGLCKPPQNLWIFIGKVSLLVRLTYN